jgi:ABC-type transporter Mla maintaining outer membrane lipid asymmetry permease subunit MlaE
MAVTNDIREVPKATTRGVVNSFVCITLFDVIFAVPFLTNLRLI